MREWSCDICGSLLVLRGLWDVVVRRLETNASGAGRWRDVVLRCLVFKVCLSCRD